MAESSREVRTHWELPFLLSLTTLVLLGSAAPSAAQETWTPTSGLGAPSARVEHVAVWTGSRMIVWGGYWEDFVGAYNHWNTGGLYDPATDTWTATSTVGAPVPLRGPKAVWTGSKMIVWGGQETSGRYTNTGGVYDPATDTWKATSLVGAPEARVGHTAIWTGSKMIVWGGFTIEDILGLPTPVYLNTGAVYDPSTDTWTPTSLVEAPEARQYHTAIWTGSKMIVWGGFGGRYTPGGSEITLDTGGTYDPVYETWTSTSLVGAPQARDYHAAVWTGSEMIVWGGAYMEDVGGWPQRLPLQTGAVYSPSSDTWTPTSLLGAPVARLFHTAVSAGPKMVVWGGYTTGGMVLRTGSIYEPGTNTWTPTIADVAPAARSHHTAVSTGSKMIVWGGESTFEMLSTGGVYSYPALLVPPADFYTLMPCRVFDTRERGGPTHGASLTCGIEQSFAIAGKCAVPDSAKAVSLNLTGTAPTASGNLRLFAAGTPVPLVSNLNYAAGQTRANNAVASLGEGGQISVLCSPAGTTHVVLDVNGYFQ